MLPDLTAASLADLPALDDMVIESVVARLGADPRDLIWQNYRCPTPLFDKLAPFEDGYSENPPDLIETPNGNRVG
jgi:hypothetical protein